VEEIHMMSIMGFSDFSSNKRGFSPNPEFESPARKERKETVSTESTVSQKTPLTQSEPQKPSPNESYIKTHSFSQSEPTLRENFASRKPTEVTKTLNLEPTPELIVGLVIDDLIKQIIDKSLDPGQENYNDMHTFFASRIQSVCKLSFDESRTVSDAMLKACKEAFPSPNRDLRAQYLSALEAERKKDNNNLPKSHDDNGSKVMVANSAQDQANNWLVDFRRSLHAQLTLKVKHKQGHLYSFSEIVDLILSYLLCSANTNQDHY